MLKNKSWKVNNFEFDVISTNISKTSMKNKYTLKNFKGQV